MFGWSVVEARAGIEDEALGVLTCKAATRAIDERWGVLSGKRKAAGRPLSMSDGLIAATALEHGHVLMTRILNP